MPPRPQYAFLEMTSGSQPGAVFPLDPKKESQLGRGVDCVVALNDPLCSRVHAVLTHRENRWWVRDGHSRNGTFVNGQKIDEAVVDDGHTVRVGSTEFTFHLGEQPPTVEGKFDLRPDETIIKDIKLSSAALPVYAPLEAGNSEQAEDLLLLYQLSIKLLGCQTPREVTSYALDLLKDRTQAAIVGFLWMDDEGQLQPKYVLPEQRAAQVSLSQSLTHLVATEGRAVWIANNRGDSAESLAQYTDALCVPLVHEGIVIGAIHLYREQSHFRQQHFEFAISLANIAAVALARARNDERVQTDLARLKTFSPGFDELIGGCQPMLELKSKIQRLGRTSGPVLIRGPSGAGKELVARALHRHSSRQDRPMLTVNCAAIPADLMESQLFGHKAGAFTGADRDHEGYFRQADLGTLFLDEIGELPLEGQAKMLRVLEGHPYLPVGGTKEVKVDVRVIAATNQDLQAYVREKKFRQDLYYRLSVFELHIPPLAQRGEDVELLVDFFLDHYRQQHGRPHVTLSPGARKKLLAYHWPGNVRQLRNVIDSAVVLAMDETIEPSDLQLRDSGEDTLDSLRIDFWEKRLITEALQRTKGSVPDAAQLLGIGRATLYRKIDEYGIQR